MPPDHTAAPRLRALIYNRVSADPSGRRISTASQDVENRAFCDRQGWDVATTITDDGRSASRYASRKREGWAEVQQAIAGKLHGRIDALVCWEASRAHRDLEDHLPLRRMCAEHGVVFCYKGRVYDMSLGDDRFSAALDVIVAEREAEQIRDRILRSHRDSASRGTPRGVTPYGYQRQYDPHSGRLVTQTINPETAPVVREMVRRVLDGETLYAVAQNLNERGVPTPRGYRDRQAGVDRVHAGWSSSMIRNLLSKQSLTGIRTHQGRVVGEATWPALIPADQWTAVQQVLRDPVRTRSSPGRTVKHLLSGIAECGVCGGWLRPMTNQGRAMYVCAGTTPTARKGHVHRPREPLDAAVTFTVLDRVSRPDFLASYARALGTVDDSGIWQAQQELAALEARMAQLEASLLDPEGISPARFAKVEAEYEPLIAAARARAQPRLAHPAVMELAGPNARNTWAAWTGSTEGLLKRRQVVRVLFQVIVHRVSNRGAPAFDYSTVDITPR